MNPAPSRRATVHLLQHQIYSLGLRSQVTPFCCDQILSFLQHFSIELTTLYGRGFRAPTVILWSTRLKEAVSIGQSAVVILIWFWQIAYTDPYNPLNPIVMRSP